MTPDERRKWNAILAQEVDEYVGRTSRRWLNELLKRQHRGHPAVVSGPALEECLRRLWRKG